MSQTLREHAGLVVEYTRVAIVGQVGQIRRPQDLRSRHKAIDINGCRGHQQTRGKPTGIEQNPSMRMLISVQK